MQDRMVKKIAGGLLALAIGAAPLAAATPAAAGDPGAAIAAGIGGFALGAIAGSAVAAPPPPAYYPDPVYAAPPPRHCWRERRPIFDEYGDVIGYRPTRVCD